MADPTSDPKVVESPAPKRRSLVKRGGKVNTRLPMIQARLDAPTREAFDAYMAKYGMTISQALRTLITMGLEESRQNPDAAFRAAAFREGLMLGVRTVKELLSTRLDKALDQAMREARR